MSAQKVVLQYGRPERRKLPAWLQTIIALVLMFIPIALSVLLMLWVVYGLYTAW